MNANSLPPNPNDGVVYDPDALRLIVLAGGCFWGTEAYLSRLPGVAETTCGYANGHNADPTYEEVCSGKTGHAEAVRVRYDPARIGLDKLLREFFVTINPLSLNRQGGDIGSQYRTGIYYDSPEDLTEIYAAVALEQHKYDQEIVTEVLPLLCFYPAEEYHQQYLEKNPGGYCHVDLRLLPKE